MSSEEDQDQRYQAGSPNDRQSQCRIRRSAGAKTPVFTQESPFQYHPRESGSGLIPRTRDEVGAKPRTGGEGTFGDAHQEFSGVGVHLPEDHARRISGRILPHVDAIPLRSSSRIGEIISAGEPIQQGQRVQSTFCREKDPQYVQTFLRSGCDVERTLAGSDLLPRCYPADFSLILTVCNLLKGLVRPAGLEPATLCLEGRCSIHLSYGRTYCVFNDL